MSDVTLFDILLPYQKRFVDSPKKRKLWLSARQVGKSFALSYLATKKVLTSGKPNSLALCISTGARASSELIKKCVQMAEAVHIINPAVTYTAAADCVKFAQGQRIVSLPSGNPPGLRGYTADIIIIDEGAYIERPKDVFAAIAPTLTRNPDAELVIASTPAGQNSWYYDMYQKALDDNEEWLVQTTTIEDAVKEGLNVDLEQLKKTVNDQDVWDREYMCRFAKAFGELIDTSVLDFVPAQQDVKARWMGMDVGSSSDRTAIVTVAELADGSMLVEDAAILHKASYEHQIEVTRELYAKFNWTAGYIDANGIGSALAEWASKKVTSKVKGFTWTGSNKTPSYEAMRAKIFDHKLKFADHLRDLVINDFNNVHRVVSEAGRVSYEAGRDGNGHSDFTSALVLAIQAAASSPIQAMLPTAARLQSVFGFNPTFSRAGATRLSH